MKKLLCLFLAFALALSLISCSEKPDPEIDLSAIIGTEPPTVDYITGDTLVFHTGAMMLSYSLQEEKVNYILKFSELAGVYEETNFAYLDYYVNAEKKLIAFGVKVPETDSATQYEYHIDKKQLKKRIYTPQQLLDSGFTSINHVLPEETVKENTDLTDWIGYGVEVDQDTIAFLQCGNTIGDIELVYYNTKEDTYDSKPLFH